MDARSTSVTADSRTWLAKKIDGLVRDFAPTVALKRDAARRMLGYNQAKRSTSRNADFSQSVNPNSQMTQRDRISMMFEARALTEEVGFVKGHQRKIQLYGAGTLAYQPNTGDRGMDSEVSEFWKEWVKNAHVSREHPLTRLMQLALMGMTRDGDSMLVFYRDECGLRLQLVDADQIGELYTYGNTQEYVGGVFRNPDGGGRIGYRVFDRVGDMMFGNPQYIHATDSVFLFDPMRLQVRGITAYDTALQDIRDKFEILDYEKVVVKDISSGPGIVTYTQRGQADEFDRDGKVVNADGTVTYIKNTEAGGREFMGIGESFQVVPHSRPSTTFGGFLKTLDQEACQGLNLPYGFVVDPSEYGGVTARIIAHVASREFERVHRDVMTPALETIRDIVLADSMWRGDISTHVNFDRGTFLFPPPPTADIERESDISIREVRAGLSTFADQYATYGQSRPEQWEIKKQEAVDRHRLAAEATKTLREVYNITTVVSPDEIAALTDNPAQQALPNPTDAAAPLPGAKSLKKFSAYMGDIRVDSLPDDTQKDIAQFIACDPDQKVVRYGMVVSELVAKADHHNLESARNHVAKASPKDAANDVRSRMGVKFILMMNDHIIDGHHFLALAEIGRVTSSLSVIDLTPLRFQIRS